MFMAMNLRWSLGPVSSVVLAVLVSCASLSVPPDDWSWSDYGARSGEVVLVDLRTPGETADGVLPGALVVDYWSPAFERFLEGADRAQVYVLYCSHGVRGRWAAERMRRAGFTVHNLTGGLAGREETK